MHVSDLPKDDTLPFVTCEDCYGSGETEFQTECDCANGNRAICPDCGKPMHVEFSQELNYDGTPYRDWLLWCCACSRMAKAIVYSL